MVQNQSGNHPLRCDPTGTILKSESFDQYQVMSDGSRRLTRRNRRYLRLFTSFQPNMSLPCMPAGAMKATATVSATSKNLRQEETVGVQRQGDQRRDEPVEGALGDCPARGTVIDLLEWAVPTAAEHRDHGPDAPAHDQDRPAAVQARGVVCGARDRLPAEPRRSTRAGRGETLKYIPAHEIIAD